MDINTAIMMPTKVGIIMSKSKLRLFLILNLLSLSLVTTISCQHTPEQKAKPVLWEKWSGVYIGNANLGFRQDGCVIWRLKEPPKKEKQEEK